MKVVILIKLFKQNVKGEMKVILHVSYSMELQPGTGIGI